MTCSETSPSACLGLDSELQVVYLGFLMTNCSIIDLARLYAPEVIAIDAPLSLPLGLSHLEDRCPYQTTLAKKGRVCERELAQLGIPCYFTTEKSIIKRLVCRGIELKNVLCQAGFNVIEVYPYASKVRLFGRGMPRKTCSIGLAFLREHLGGILPGLALHLTALDHNLCDAAVGAYTASIYCQGRADALGNDNEGLIYVPSPLAHNEVPR